LAREHARLYRANLARVTALPPPDAAAVVALRPEQEAYIELALTLTSDPLNPKDLQAQRQLSELTTQFFVLERKQAAVTDRLAALEHRTSRDGDRRQKRSEALAAAAALGALVGVLLLASWLTRLGRELTRALASERDIATTLQNAMLPDVLPDLPGVQVAARYLPAGRGAQVGGDWYDVLLLRDGRIGFVVGDVVGHDMQAAAVMGQVRNALRAYAHESADPGTVLTRLNDLCLQQGPEHGATCVFAVVDPARSTLTLSSAGHHPPVLADEQGHAVLLDVPAQPPLGAVPRTCYQEVVVPLQRGMLLLYTDGLVERRAERLETAEARLLASAQICPVNDPAAACTLVLEQVMQTEPEDDVVVLAVALAPDLGPRLDLEVPAVPSSLATVRRAVTRWLSESDADEAEAYEILVAVGEATSNAVEHAYGPGGASTVRLECVREGDLVTVVVADDGRWREARGRDRGRGLGMMRGLMDDVEVETGDDGTRVRLERRLVGSAVPTGSPR
jgi:serine phosphatase RsbU (regulator of sigma subunit)/anti-sigma regulatory factor (Ser/Thr protein kinase)